MRYEVPDSEEDKVVSKRVMLSKIAQFYDPVGLVDPVIILAKMLLQVLCRLSLNWDDQVPKELESNWQEYQSRLKLLENWKIERMIKAPQVKDIQLHWF